MKAPEERLNPLTVLLLFVALALLARGLFTEPVTPDEDDCLARARAKCWEDRPVYDELGRRVP